MIRSRTANEKNGDVLRESIKRMRKISRDLREQRDEERKNRGWLDRFLDRVSV